MRPISAPTLGEVLLALSMGGGSVSAAKAYAAGRGPAGDRAAAVLRAAVGSSTPQDFNAASAVAVEVAAAVAQQSIFGRLTTMGAQQRPFRTALHEVTGRLRASFLRSGQAAPVSSAGFDGGAMLSPFRCESHWLSSTELARASPTVAAAAFAADAIRAISDGIDARAFASGAVHSDDGPAALTWASPSFASSGSSVAQVDADLLLLLKSVTVQGFSPSAWILPSSALAFLSALRTSGGNLAFPMLQASAPVLHTLPVLASAALEMGGSPAGNSLHLVDARFIRHADGGEVGVEASTRASVHTDDAPTANAAAGTGGSAMVSTFQTGTIAFRATCVRDWHLIVPAAGATLSALAF